MSRRSYFLHLAVAIILVTNLLHLAAAPPPVEDPGPEGDAEVQLQLNTDVKSGVVGTEEVWHGIISKHSIQQLIYLCPAGNGQVEGKATSPVEPPSPKRRFSSLKKFSTRKRLGSSESERLKEKSAVPIKTWHGLQLLLPDPKETDESIIDWCGTKRSLLIGSDIRRLKRLKRLEKEKLDSDAFEKLHRCIVTLSAGTYPDLILRSFAFYTQDDLNAFLLHIHFRMYLMSSPKTVQEEPPSLVMLLKFMINRGSKVFVVGWESTAISSDNMLTDDFKEFAKLVEVEGLLLYIVSFEKKKNPEEFIEQTKNRLRSEGLKVEDVFVAKPSYPTEFEPRNMDFLKEIKEGKDTTTNEHRKQLFNEELVLIDCHEENAKAVGPYMYLAIHVSGEDGFKLATLKAVESSTAAPPKVTPRTAPMQRRGISLPATPKRTESKRAALLATPKLRRVRKPAALDLDAKIPLPLADDQYWTSGSSSEEDPFETPMVSPGTAPMPRRGISLPATPKRTESKRAALFATPKLKRFHDLDVKVPLPRVDDQYWTSQSSSEEERYLTPLEMRELVRMADQNFSGASSSSQETAAGPSTSEAKPSTSIVRGGARPKVYTGAQGLPPVVQRQQGKRVQRKVSSTRPMVRPPQMVARPKQTKKE